jgi:hypothetical protein
MWFYGSIFAHLWTYKWNGAKRISSIKKKLHYVNYLINHKLFLHFSQMPYELCKCWWMLSQLSSPSVWGIQPFTLTLSLMKNSMINDFYKIKIKHNFPSKLSFECLKTLEKSYDFSWWMLLPFMVIFSYP